MFSEMFKIENVNQIFQNFEFTGQSFSITIFMNMSGLELSENDTNKNEAFLP